MKKNVQGPSSEINTNYKILIDVFSWKERTEATINQQYAGYYGRSRYLEMLDFGF